jgi:N-acetyl-alpha-D-muramate 1-phosphate uridylyltransferase
MTLPVAILAGGLAQRLRPYTDTVPKALIEVAGRPFAEHQLNWLRTEHVDRVVFLVGYRGEMIQDALGDGSRWRLSIEYVFDGPRLLGTGGALRRALPVLGDAFFVMYGDSYLDCDLADVARTFQAHRAEALMTVFRNDNRWDTSNVEFQDGRILRYDKRSRTPAMRHIDYGLGVLSPSPLERYPAETPFDLADVYQEILARGALAAYEVSSRFYEIGTPAGLEETRAHLAFPRAGRS